VVYWLGAQTRGRRSHAVCVGAALSTATRSRDAWILTSSVELLRTARGRADTHHTDPQYWPWHTTRETKIIRHTQY
jgi:hypothetical protein